MMNGFCPNWPDKVDACRCAANQRLAQQYAFFAPCFRCEHYGKKIEELTQEDRRTRTETSPPRCHRCGTRLGPNNRSGYCQRCYHKPDVKRALGKT